MYMHMATPDCSKFVEYCHMFYYKQKEADPLNLAAFREIFVCAGYVSGLKHKIL